MIPALETTGLARRYGRQWALRDCSLRLPAGKIAALVGPNGAGKTTLLHLIVGLLTPTTGSVRVFGRPPADNVEVLARIGFVAQDVPLYADFRVEEMLRLGRKLNLRWDDPLARDRLRRINVPLDQRVGTLSGGQRAQVALAMALAKHPELLVLDEPLASLDPLARREFLQALMDGVVENGATVLLSSHLISDLERVCDYLIVLHASRVQVLGETEHLLATHRMLTGPRADASRIPGIGSMVWESHTPRQTSVLARLEEPVLDPAWTARDVTLEELVLAYLSQPSASTLPGPQIETNDCLEVKA